MQAARHAVRARQGRRRGSEAALSVIIGIGLTAKISNPSPGEKAEEHD
jgi:hypothetical protein